LNNAVKQPGRAARIGLWLLPAYGLLLGLSTLTHQPPVADFDAYARYITTDTFLVSHLGASILGAALAVLGVVAVTAYLVSGRAAGLAVRDWSSPLSRIFICLLPLAAQRSSSPASDVLTWPAWKECRL
jgi:hypothetical protein